MSGNREIAFRKQSEEEESETQPMGGAQRRERAGEIKRANE